MVAGPGGAAVWAGLAAR